MLYTVLPVSLPPSYQKTHLFSCGGFSYARSQHPPSTMEDQTTDLRMGRTVEGRSELWDVRYCAVHTVTVGRVRVCSYSCDLR